MNRIAPCATTTDSSGQVTQKSPPLAGDNGVQKQVFWLNDGGGRVTVAVTDNGRSQSARKLFENCTLTRDGFPRDYERGHIEAAQSRDLRMLQH